MMFFDRKRTRFRKTAIWIRGVCVVLSGLQNAKIKQ